MTMSPFAEKVRAALLAELPETASALSETGSGELRLQVSHPRIPCGLWLETEGGGITIGFREWHIHSDSLGGSTESERIMCAVAYVRDILRDKVPIVICSVSGQFTDAWVTEDENDESEYRNPGESFHIGRWSQLAS